MNNQLAKNLIFDLGGVIINIDLHLAMLAFGKLANKNADDLKQRFWSSDFFLAHETGHCSDVEFRRQVCGMLQKDFSDEELDQAWNAILLDIPAARIELLKQLRNQYNLYLLSNTNAIHIQAVNQQLQEKFSMESLHELFDKVYYSYQIGYRKPGTEIYTHVLTDAGLVAEETIFLDDSPANLQGAAQVGIQTVLIRPGQFTIMDYFQNSI